MVVDSSALVAILLREEEADEIEMKLVLSTGSSISAANYVETCMVMARESGDDGFRQVDKLLEQMSIHIHSVTIADSLLARDAFLRYGKGRHPAGLNFGDCFSYALAKRLGEPLLFKGNDFSLTDAPPA